MPLSQSYSGDFGPRIFRDFAANYAEHGLTVFPVGGASGKEPLVRNWRKFTPRTWEKLSDRFAGDNIGILNDSGITIVDIDDSKLANDMIKRFGDTPIKIATPSNGYHFWYKSQGETRRIGIDGLKVDILGKGGFAVAPPSTRFNKGSYHFIEGSELDIPKLPTLKQGSLPANDIKACTIGFRNNELFYFCKKKATTCTTETELLEIAANYNNEFNPPLNVNEVQKVVFKIWEYKTEGNLLNKGDNKMIIDLGLLSLTYKPDALALMLTLQKNHGARTIPFSIDQEKVKSILRWRDRRRVKNAIEILIIEDLLKLIGKGGPTGRAYQYRLLI